MANSSDINNQGLARASIEQAPEGVFWVNPNGLFHHANPRFCKRVSYRESELKALHICNLVTDWPRSQWSRRWQQCRDRQLMFGEGGLTTKFGDVVAVEIRVTLIKLNEKELMCGFVRDIARRKKDAGTLMAELKASEERFRLLYDNAPVMLQVCDFETRMFSVNQYWLDTIGYAWDEVIGRQTLEFMTEYTRAKVSGKVLPILRQTGSIHNFEY